MIKFFKPKISIVIPLGLLIFDVVISLFIWRYEIFSQCIEIERANLESVMSVMNRLQTVIEDNFRQGDEKSIASEIAIMATFRNRDICFLTDENDRILYATRYDLVGSSAEDILSSHTAADKDKFLEHAKKIRGLMRGEVHLSSDKDKIIAHYPVLLSLREGEIRPKHIGTIFLQYDLSSLKKSMRYIIEHQIIVYSLFVFAISIILWVFFYFMLTRRVTKLAVVTQHFADGDMRIRADTRRQDELGVLGQAFNAMVEKIGAEINERKRVLEELRKSEENLLESRETFRALFEEAPLPYQSLDEVGNFLYVNNTWLTVLGYKREEVVGKNFADFLAGNWDEAFKERFPKFKATGRICALEFEMLKKDGSAIWVQFDGRIAHDKGGNFKQTHCIFSDVTERKRVEAALRSEQQFTKALLDSLPGIFYLYTYPELRLVLWNKNHETLLGFTSAEVNNRYIMEWHVPGVSEIVQKAVDVAMEKGMNALEAPLVHKDGHYIPFLMTGIRFESQGKLYLMGVGVDITDRKKAEEKNLQLAAIVESSDDAIIGKDLEGNITSWNKGAEKMYGYSENEVIGRSISILFPPDRKNDLSYILNKVIQGEYIEHYETERIKKDGTRINVFLAVSGIKDSQNKIIGASIISHDITERKRAEQSQRLAQMGQLIAVVAHEVNNPLMIISSAAQLSLMEKSGNKEVETNLKDIFEQCVRAKDIIHRFLMFARPSKGEVKEVDIKNILETIIQLIEHQFSLDNIKITRHYYALPLIVKVDDKLMQEVFMNLLNNARDAVSSGGGISVSTSKEGDNVHIEISDTGAGISEENLAKLFQPFFTTKEKGVGLGLLVSNGIVQAYGGSIRYKSVVGVGTTAIINLPLERRIDA